MISAGAMAAAVVAVAAAGSVAACAVFAAAPKVRRTSAAARAPLRASVEYVGKDYRVFQQGQEEG